MSQYKRGTICVQGGYHPENGEPRQNPTNDLVAAKITEMERISD